MTWRHSLKRIHLILPLLLLAICLSSVESAGAAPRPGRHCELALVGEQLTDEQAGRIILDYLKDHELQGQLEFDDFSMVVPKRSQRELRDRSALTLPELKERIHRAHAEGRHVLSLTGSFDLIHQGHAGFVIFIRSEYERVMGIPKDQSYLVVMADDDDLISIGKSYKHVSNGGDEDFLRPIQSAQAVPAELHTRLIDLASFPLELAALTPSPRSGAYLFEREDFRSALARRRQQIEPLRDQLMELPHLSAADRDSLQRTVRVALNMIDLILKGQSQELIAEYLRSADKKVADNSEYWFLPSWHLLLNLYLTDGLEASGRLYRFLNKRDGEYLMRVALMNNLSGFDVFFLQGTNATKSTSAILKEHGAQTLIEAKRRALPKP